MEGFRLLWKLWSVSITRVGGLDPGQKLLNMNMQERLYLKEDL